MPSPPDHATPCDFGSAFRRAIARLPQEPGGITVLFSGGLDSSLLAWELRQRPGTVLWTIGREGSPDLTAARSAATAMGLPWQHAPIAPADVEEALDRFAPELEGAEGPAFDVAVALALALDRTPTALAVAGQGADELFLGYAHFRGLSEGEATHRADLDLRHLTETEWPRTERIAARAGRRLVAPFLDPEVQRAAGSIPIPERMPEGVPKRWLREWAIARGLPREIASRPKRAIQYGSQVQRMIRELRPAPRSR
jgi:asparagine synthase (glutamine-hydrolysing)